MMSVFIKHRLTAFLLLLAVYVCAFAQTDVTSAIVNPDFDGLSFAGWQQQGLQFQTNNDFTGKKGFAYVERWVSKTSTLPDSYIRQRLTGLANGRYTLTVSAQHILQDSNSPATGAVVFADWQQTEVTSAADYSLTFDVLTGDVTIGLRTEGSKGNWLACDNWRLTLVGTDVAYQRSGLTTLIATAQALTTEAMDASVLADLQGAIAAAQRYTATGTAANISSAATTLKAAMQAAERSTFAVRTTTSGTVPAVVTDSRYARGATAIFARSTVNSSAAILEQGFCYSTSNTNPTVADPRTTRYLENGGRIYCLDNLQPATLYYIRAYAVTTDYHVGYGSTIPVYTLPKGNVNWGYGNEGDGLINARISQSAASVAALWSNLTSINGAYLNVHYASGTPTADCSYGGYIRVGPTESYQATGTLLHEMGHGIGVGTHSTYTGDIRSESSRGLWYGKRATRFLQFWDNSNDVRLTGDGTHLWATGAAQSLSYTINGAHEDNHSDASYYGNSLLMQAIVEDGLAPVDGKLQGLAYTLDVADGRPFVITCSDVALGQLTSFLTDEGGTLLQRQLTADEALIAANGALWTFAFDPATQTYRIRNEATGRYITYSAANSSNGFRTSATASAEANLRLQLSFVDVSVGNGDKYLTLDAYHIMRPTQEAAPQALCAVSTTATASTPFSNTRAATAQRWLILDTESLRKAEDAFEPLPDYGFDITTAMAPYLCTGSLKDWTNDGMVVNYTNGGAPYVNTADGSRIDFPFIERWVTSSSSLPDSELSQTLTELPDGNYTLTASVIATRQDNSDVVISGVTFYAGDQSVACATANGVPKTYALHVKVSGGKLNFGLAVKSANASWVALDNLHLYFDGTASDYCALATPCQPVRMPIANPTFDNNSTSGWDITGNWALNHDNGPEHPNFNWPYVEWWVNSAAQADRSLLQTATLPQGRYSLQAAVEAVRQDQLELTVSGVSLCLGSESVGCHTANKAPEQFVVETEHTGGDLTLGLQVASTDANWVAVDNFVLRYYGPYSRADVNRDGSVTIADVTTLVNIILGKENAADAGLTCRADINSDGNITIADVTALVNIILGKEAE